MNRKELDTFLLQKTEYENSKETPISMDIKDYQNLPLVREIRSTDSVIISKQDRFHCVPAHSHNWFELAVMYSGSCSITLNRQIITLKKGQCLLIDANTLHSCSSCGKNDILINFLIKKSYLETHFFQRFSKENYISQFLLNSINNHTNKNGFLYFETEDNPTLFELFTGYLCEYYGGKNSVYLMDKLDNYLALIFLELTDSFVYQAIYEDENQETSPIFSILKYMEKNCTTCSLEDVAKEFHLNKNYLSGYIHKTTGYTYKKIIQSYRLEYALRLLKKTDLTITEVSHQVGYENVNFFYKKFYENYQCTPKEYRKNSND